jgi:hypothetical protein
MDLCYAEFNKKKGGITIFHLGSFADRICEMHGE